MQHSASPSLKICRRRFWNVESEMGKRFNTKLGGPSTWKKRERPVDEYQRRKMAEGIYEGAFVKFADVTVDFVMGMDGRMIQTRSPPQEPLQLAQREIDGLRRSLEGAQSGIKERDEFIAKLKESPQSIVTVQSLVTPLRGVVQVGGAALEINLPVGCRVGDQVKIIVETSQAVSKADEPLVFGPVVTVERTENGRCYFESTGGGQQQSANLAEAMPFPQPGDRVQLDQSGTVALLNLGRDKSKFSLENAPSITWDDIGGHDECKEAIREAIEYPKAFAETYKAYGQKPSKGILLYGPAGTGKTLLAKAAANSVGDGGGAFIYVKGAELLSKWVGESESTVRSLFARAREHKKLTGNVAVIFIDEADALLGVRGGGGIVSAMTSTIVPSFLAEMDGVEDSSAFVILATNRPDTLDPAIVRDGRIDRRIRVGRPDRKSTVDILHLAMRGRLCENFETLAPKVADLLHSDLLRLYQIGFDDGHDYVRFRDLLSGAVIAGVVNRATAIAIRRDRATQEHRGIQLADLDLAARESFREMAGVNHFEVIAERIESIGKIPTDIRKAKFHAGAEEAAEFGQPTSYQGAHVQGARGGAPN
jgi:proteasome-associated ATPase